MIVFRLILKNHNSFMIWQGFEFLLCRGQYTMERKPDIIKSVVLIFAVGLVITGFTSLQASEDRRGADVPVMAGESAIAPLVRE